MKKLLCALLSLLMLFVFSACGNKDENSNTPSTVSIVSSGTDNATIVNTKWALSYMASGETIYTAEELSASGVSGSIIFTAEQFTLDLPGSVGSGAYSLNGTTLTLYRDTSQINAVVEGDLLTLNLQNSSLSFTKASSFKVLKASELEGSKWKLISTYSDDYGIYTAADLDNFGMTGELFFADGMVAATSKDTLTSFGKYAVVDDNSFTMTVADGELKCEIFANTLTIDYDGDTMTYELISTGDEK